jgi:hypothetical protein
MIDAAELDVFSYDDDTHTYRNSRDEVRPSVTETLKHGGLFDYSRIDPRLLERKRIIGSNVHAWTAEYDRTGDDDLLKLSPDEEPYARAYLAFRRDLKMQILDVELPMLRPIHGLEIGGTPDRRVRIGQRIYILDLKCVAAFHHAWRLQLADYVMMLTGRPDCSMYGRAIVRLRPDGAYRYDPIDPKWDETDSAVAAAFVQTFVWKRNHRLL